jgi:hypothetical protein
MSESMVKKIKPDHDIQNDGLDQEQTINMPIGVCVKVSSLRPQYTDLEDWLKNKKHVLVCRGGRVFIGSGEKKRVFHYSGSEFANPFKVQEHGLDNSLRLFTTHLDCILEDPKCRERFLKLAECEEVGCFCEPNARCHRDIILAKIKMSQ